MGTYNNIDAVVRRLQQRYVALQRGVLGLDVLLVAMAVSFLATVLLTLLGEPVSLRLAYSAIAAAAVGVFVALAWRVRLPASTALIRADHALRFQEQLSTAYEYLHQHPSNPFVPPLAAAAERLASQVEPRSVFPLRLPRRAWGILGLMVALGGFLYLPIAPVRFDDLRSEHASQEAIRQGERLERWGQRLEQQAQQERLDRSAILARHMQDLGRRLQREGSEASQLKQRIATLSQYLQRMQQELQERALMNDANLLSAHDVLASGKSVKQELRDLLQLLQNNALPRESAAAAEQGLLRLRRQVGKSPELEEMIQNLQAGNIEAARQLLQDILQNQQAAEEMEHLERARRALEYSSRSGQHGDSGEPSTSDTPPSGDMAESEFTIDYDGEMMSEYMPGMEDFGAPGAEEGFGTSRHSRETSQPSLRESPQPATQVQVKSGEGAMRLSYIRYLPLQNDARVPLEQVTVHYERAAQEVLSQERIPWDYREQIKQYFLAIGMVPGGKP